MDNVKNVDSVDKLKRADSGKRNRVNNVQSLDAVLPPTVDIVDVVIHAADIAHTGHILDIVPPHGGAGMNDPRMHVLIYYKEGKGVA